VRIVVVSKARYPRVPIGAQNTHDGLDETKNSVEAAGTSYNDQVTQFKVHIFFSRKNLHVIGNFFIFSN
jgi:hypothetical protein